MALEKSLLSLRVHIMTSVVRHSEPDITDLGRLIWKAFLLLYEKSKCEKISICECEIFWHLNLMWICFCYLYGVNSIKTDLWLTDWLIHKLQVQHFWLNLSYSNGKNKSTSNVKEIHICQWISFHILTFHILEEMAYCQVLSQVNNHKGR